LTGDATRPWLVADESRAIGQVNIPGGIFANISQAPLVILESSIEERSAALAYEYVGPERLCCAETRKLYTIYLQRISKALGGVRSANALKLLNHGFAAGTSEAHVVWIRYLLENYYDPYYQRHLENNAKRVVFRAGYEELYQYLVSEMGK
jgi:tRNA 2-selenouridine synthase